LLPDETEFYVASLGGYCRFITRQPIRFLAARFSHPGPLDPGEHTAILRCPVAFDAPDSGLLISTADLAARSVHAEPDTLRATQRIAAERLAALDDSSTAQRVRDLLAREPGKEPPDLHEAAHGLHMSSRTLQRRLNEEGTSYRGVVDDDRRERSCRELLESDLSIHDIALRVGFSDVSAFYRAFRRWTGATPAEFRRSKPPDR
jgi:AraC-like DNA-binding protein